MIRTVIFIMTFSLCVSAVWARDERSIKKLQDALVALAPDVDLGEAELLSVTAHTASRSLAREYGLVWSPIFQNFLIHMGKDSEYDLAQGAGSRRTRATELFRAQRPERQPGYYGITAWKEDSLYTAWLHDYERSWEWHPIAR
ncbi:MAG: hypothetical protein DMC60_13885 [Verrucomicrobia bacterium]|nr:MAG: hypothetical protein DMC60_13885 [Verrucomicrobiota bacterium]